MTSREIFEFEIAALEQEIGKSAESRTYRVLAEVVRWLRQSGHGNVTLSAVNNLLGTKIRTETIIGIEHTELTDNVTT
jgi:hypothetical protein